MALGLLPGNVPHCAAEGKVMKRISGKFDVKLARQAPASDGADGGFGRMLIDKKFHGELDAVSKGQLISEGLAGYVAMERVEGTLQGRKGTFVLQHSATMDGGKPRLTVTVVPDSGTGQLQGLAGSMSIRIEGDAHFYDFEYAIDQREDTAPQLSRAPEDPLAQDLIRAEEDWSRAIVSNEPEAIGSFMADDWVIIGPDGSTSDRASFLALVSSGALTHDVMDCDEARVRMYGDIAVVTLRCVSGGKYQGQPFKNVERVSDVYVRQEGRWKCVLTHLSPISKKEAR
jgi:ketosteroid isomerase-like protein